MSGTRDVLKCYDIVARLYGGDAFADRFDDTGAFMAENDGKGAFGVFA